MTIHLSKRLQSIADFVEPGSRIADIGTDHAYIPIALAQAKSIEYAVASDIGAGPCAIAQANVAHAQVQDLVVVRQADGLQGITPADGIDTVIIAGMGGQLMVEILTAGADHLDGTESLILEPNRDDYTVRAWLAAHEFGILDEDLLEDDGHVYPIIVAGQTKPEVPYTEADLLLGPVLRQKRSPLFLRQLDRLIATSQHILAGLRQANQLAPAKVAAEAARLQLLQEVRDAR
ncbi:tRNA (adenine(22)-N(1))-methyltransferase [Lacticaseibacillus baoqingensis]|uniref:tRNA (Adenine(22)-N(1))-methyltransferase n=1 Tax=Lacticaseibacillus baoqingensis TaxID=2486013 RepID=A0ABW4E7M5_9LACO|nr:class I SAM-dependent methyltransferase [Lacticaseibacillus baoqingensis]